MNELSQHTALENLKRKAASLYTTVEAEQERAKTELAKWNGEQARKKYSPDHLRAEAESIRERAKTFASLQDAELRNIQTRIQTARQAWDTATLMKRARLVPESDKIEADLLEELKRLRLAGDLQAATPDELIEAATEAKEGANLAMLSLLRREAARRQYGSDIERAKVKTAVDRAVSEVSPPGRSEALQLVSEAELNLEMAADSLAELTTGQTPARLQMRRTVAARAGDDAAS
jgi:hypothetical protein